MVLMAADTNDTPYRATGTARKPIQLPLFHQRWQVLVFLPALTSLLCQLSDAYFALFYISPLDGETSIGAWSGLSLAEQWKLALMDGAGLLLLTVLASYCWHTVKYRQATEGLIQGFGVNDNASGPETSLVPTQNSEAIAAHTS